MNLASQLALSAFSQSPVVEEGLTVAKNFAENRFILLKAFDTVLSHGEKLPPVKLLSTDYSGDSSNASYMFWVPEPSFEHVYEMPTTAEGGVVIEKAFASRVKEAAAYPHDDLRRRAYRCLIACSYIHELMHNKVHRFLVKDFASERKHSPITLKASWSQQVESDYYAEEKLFGGCLQIEVSKRFHSYEIAVGGRNRVNVYLQLPQRIRESVKNRPRSVYVTEQYISLLERILTGELLYGFDDTKSLYAEVIKSLALEENGPDAEYGRGKRKKIKKAFFDDDSDSAKSRSHIGDEDSSSFESDESDDDEFSERIPEAIILTSDRENEFCVEVQDSSMKPLFIVLEAHADGLNLRRKGRPLGCQLGATRPTEYIRPGRMVKLKVDQLFEGTEDFSKVTVIVHVGLDAFRETEVVISV